MGHTLETPCLYYDVWCKQKKVLICFCLEASAKMKDGVENAFEEVVIKILQTPELWDVRKEGVKLVENHILQDTSSCTAYCSLA